MRKDVLGFLRVKFILEPQFIIRSAVLTALFSAISVTYMRTTVTLDPDTELLLKDEVKRSGKSFKRVLNESIREALGSYSPSNFTVQPLFTSPFPKHLQNLNFNQLPDLLDDQETLEKLKP